MSDTIQQVEPANSVVEMLPPAPPAPPLDGLLALVERALMDPRVDVEKLARILEMRSQLEQAEAKAAFNEAIARAKANIGPILKGQTVDYTFNNKRTYYKYEDFASVARAVDAPLSAEGLSYRFSATQNGKMLRVTCILSRGKYSEDTTLEAMNDTSGGKNDVQGLGSTASYLQRYSLKLALGLAAAVDDDGRGRPPTEAPEPAEPEPAPAEGRQEQRDELRGLIIRAVDRPEDIPAFERRIRDYVKADDILTMTAQQLDRAVAAVRKFISDKGDKQ